MVTLMRTRNTSAKRQIQKEKGDLLAQKWMTNLLAVILVLLVIAFVVLSIPTVKKHIVEFVRVLRYGREQKPERPKIAPSRLQIPFFTPMFLLKGDDIHAYQLGAL